MFYTKETTQKESSFRNDTEVFRAHVTGILCSFMRTVKNWLRLYATNSPFVSRYEK